MELRTAGVPPVIGALVPLAIEPILVNLEFEAVEYRDEVAYEADPSAATIADDTLVDTISWGAEEDDAAPPPDFIIDRENDPDERAR